MYGKNIVAKFETAKGSVYTVTEDRVLRNKKADSTIHDGHHKNIFYCSYADSEDVLKNYKAGGSMAGGEFSFKTASGGEKTITLYDTPALGLCPIDACLHSNGDVKSDDRLHVGHAITQIL